ncbi:glycosyltransferase family 2 protein [Cytophaga aurantiaca]|uniref:glycosyltransferase family 2 protein n=1 Tax=Cytophaga aurantiaca TaxID=29530 RepID=UPI000378E480|nr:glycosyltransferase [Cytophaga aurantiaca]
MDGREQPLVTVIALSYNHAPYIKEALESVYNQTYSNIELIIVDDASTDASAAVIEEYIQGRSVQFFKNDINAGNCRSFNNAFALAKGAYIIDFALDDLMYSTRIEKQVALFQQSDKKTGVVFTNVDLIDINGKVLSPHYPAFHHKSHPSKIPEGNVFDAVLSQYYINPVGMMVRREVFEKLNGYDESLAYEDFDFWIRSSRIVEYRYIPEILSAKRNVPASLSSGFYTSHKEFMFDSTLQVCRKAWWLCRSDSEKQALVKRCRYEARQAYRYNYVELVEEYLNILKLYDPVYWLYKPFVQLSLWFRK